MERKDFVMLPFASWHIRDFALLANTLIKILARGVGQNEIARTLVKCRLVCWCVIVKLSLETGGLLESLITACGFVTDIMVLGAQVPTYGVKGLITACGFITLLGLEYFRNLSS